MCFEREWFVKKTPKKHQEEKLLVARVRKTPPKTGWNGTRLSTESEKAGKGGEAPQPKSIACMITEEGKRSSTSAKPRIKKSEKRCGGFQNEKKRPSKPSLRQLGRVG